MNCKTNKLKYNCGTKTSARCVFYELDLPEISKLKILNECISIEETTDDLYNLIDFVIDAIDTDGLGTKCLEYKRSKSKYNPQKELVLVKDVLLKFEDEICKLKEVKTGSIAGGGIDISKLNLKCLTDPCNNTIDTELKLLQALIDKVCSLEELIKNNIR